MATFPSETNNAPILRWTDTRNINRDLIWKHQIDSFNLYGQYIGIYSGVPVTGM